MYYFSMATVTNYHKLSGFKQPKFIILQFGSSEVHSRSHCASIEVSAGLFLLQAVGENLSSYF